MALQYQWPYLSADRVAELLADDWSGSGPLRLARDVTAAEVAGATIVANVGAVLRAAHDRGVLPVARADARPALRQEIRWAPVPGFTPALRTGLTATGGLPLIHPLAWTETLAHLAGLLENSPLGYTLTALGRRLMPPERAGELFPLVLRAFFRRFDVAGLDHWPALPGLADLTALWMWYLTGPAGRIGVAGAFLPMTLTPPLLFQRHQRAAEPVKPWAIVQVRFLDPLADFGLVTPVHDIDLIEDVGDVEYLKQPLFDRAIRFTIPPARAAEPAPPP
jgi:hypothetical protein